MIFAVLLPAAPAGAQVVTADSERADTIFGSALGDVLAGSFNDDRISAFGGPGEDRLDGGSGPDRVDGGPGRDHLFASGAADVVEGDPGDDEIVATDARTIDCGDGEDRLTLQPSSGAELHGCETVVRPPRVDLPTGAPTCSRAGAGATAAWRGGPRPAQ